MGNASGSLGGGDLPHWGLSRETFAKLSAIVPRSYFERMRVYFELYGCLVCRRRREAYFSSGMCRRCTVRVQDRLRRCVRVLAKRQSEAVQPVSNEMVFRVRSARALLADLKATRPIGPRHLIGPHAVPRVITLRVAGEKGSGPRSGERLHDGPSSKRGVGQAVFAVVVCP